MTKLSQLSRSIEGKVALVTGAASGMGRATAFVLADEGAHVAVTDINDVGPVVEAITAAGGSAHGWRLDVGDADAIARVVPDAAERFGGLDILINNAGVQGGAPIDGEGFEATWDRALSVMLTAHQRMIRAALPYLRRAEHPRVVNIASTEGLGATKGYSPYVAAKTGVIGLTRALAVDLGREGITVNCICPGPIRTGMTEEIPEADKQIYARRRVALKRYADPEEVAHMTVSLCLPAAGFTTGVTLPVDGGLTIKNA
ncbi:MAG: SDR family NAD(P)-dependent oxidoreductase [Chloroflexota bacterium]|nr:SDR family NAD(P)-dependent oxidoreductase [Chloroflexota bacterium]